jgi:hypothetical protein
MNVLAAYAGTIKKEHGSAGIKPEEMAPFIVNGQGVLQVEIARACHATDAALWLAKSQLERDGKLSGASGLRGLATIRDTQSAEAAHKAVLGEAGFIGEYNPEIALHWVAKAAQACALASTFEVSDPQAAELFAKAASRAAASAAVSAHATANEVLAVMQEMAAIEAVNEPTLA